MKNFFIIDGHNLAFRAHNAHFELRKANGDPSGMFYGFIRMLVSLKKKYRGYKFVVTWDNRADKKFEIQPDYKAGRASLPSIVYKEMDDLKEFLKACGVEQYEKKGEEADDIIASLAEKFKTQQEGGVHIIIYSNDKDMLQLVEDGAVTVYKPKVGQTPEKFFDEEAVKEEYGVLPKRLAEFRSYDGDTSDNITGIPRVRRKVIANLLNKVDSIQFLAKQAANSTELSDKEREAILEFHPKAMQNYSIVKLRKDISDIQVSEATYSKEKLEAFFQDYEIKSIKPDEVIELFQSSLNVRYTEARPSYKLETFSLFD